MMVKTTICSDFVSGGRLEKAPRHGVLQHGGERGVVPAGPAPGPRASRRPRLTPTPGLHEVHRQQPDGEREGRDDLEVEQRSDRERPTRLRSSPWPAIPTTSVANSSGTISDVIIRRNSVERNWRSVAWKPRAVRPVGKADAEPDADDHGDGDPPGWARCGRGVRG